MEKDVFESCCESASSALNPKVQLKTSRLVIWKARASISQSQCTSKHLIVLKHTSWDPVKRPRPHNPLGTVTLSDHVLDESDPTPKQPHQAHSSKKAATRVSHDTLILSVTHIFHSTDARPLKKSGRRSERNTLFDYCFALSEFPWPTGEGPTAQALWPVGQVSVLCTRS